jgi:hypothetical protein
MEKERNPQQDSKSDEDKPIATHTTTFSGPVTAGGISTGSGSIYIGSQALDVSTVSTKDEFLAALREFKKELEAAQRQGLPKRVTDDVIVEIEAVEREALSETPQLERITKRLENAKKVLVEATGVVAAATAAAAAASKLVPFVQSTIEAASRLF